MEINCTQQELFILQTIARAAEQQGVEAWLAVGVAMGLATLIGPLAGGIVAFLLFAGVAGGLAWYGLARLRKDL